MTFIKRIGNKARIANKIEPYFAPHTTYIELFFGGGGMFFNKKRAKYNFLNDKDENIYNVFKVLRSDREALYSYIESVPYCSKTFDYIRKNKNDFNDIEKVGNFLLLAAWSFLGKGETLLLGLDNAKKILLQNVEKTYKSIMGDENRFMNYDFRDVLSKVSLEPTNHPQTLIYADPPYLDTMNNYKAGVWTKEDSLDLLKMCAESPCKFAISEFDDDFILENAKELSLNVITIGERKNLGNRRTEVLITNYNQNFNLF